MTSGRRWQRARQISQILFLLLFVYLVVGTARRGTTVLPGDLFLRFDPLAALAAQLGGRTLLLRFLPAILLIACAFVAGRFWCGWICPLGTTLDYVTPRRKRRQADEPATGLRSIKYVLLSFIAFSALLGSLTLMILDPITIIGRTLITAVLPAINYGVTTLETALYPIAVLQAPLDLFEKTFRGNILATTQPFFQLNILLFLAFALIVGLNWVAPRFWCRYLCPLGALLALPARLAIWRPRATGDCTRCAVCVRECPTGAITSKRGFEVDARECVMCMDCQVGCPEQAIVFSRSSVVAELPEQKRDYDPSRRQALAAVGVSVAAVALFRTEPAARRDNPWLLRPPGARQTAFLSRCIRCGACIKVCPTGALQPSTSALGLEGTWTPSLVPRLGFCDFSCNACGQVCPTGAIPALSLEQKRVQVIGQAYIDQNRCLPWADNRKCIVCEEMCPVSPKAIELDEQLVMNAQQEEITVRRPRVIREKCIGCGVCEYQCPLNGSAAIRVYTPNLFTAQEVS
jgi:ferredoxin